MNINWLDAAILLTFFLLGFLGLVSGLVRSGITTLALLLGVVLAGVFYQRLASDLHVFISDPTTSQIIAVLLIFLAAVLAGQLLAAALKGLIAILFFGPLDSAGGLVLGLIEAFLVVELVLIVFVLFRDRVDFMQSALANSSLAPFFLRHFPIVVHILPSEFRQAVTTFVQQSH